MASGGDITYIINVNGSGAINGINNVVSSMDKLNQMSQKIMLAGVGMTAAITTPLIAAGFAGIKFDSAMEQANVNFTTLLGSAEKSKKMVGDLKKFADETPFEMTGLAKSAQTLLSFGVTAKDIMPDIKMLGDVSLGNKEKFDSLSLAFAQIQATGRLMGQDLLQLVNAGFNPLQIMSEKTGISMKDLKDKMEKGAISSDMVTKAFQVATSEGGRFYKAMDSASKTMEGQMSTLKDAVNSTLGQILKPLFDELRLVIIPKVTEEVKKLSDWFSNLSPTIQKNILMVVGLVAAIGPLLLATGGLIKAFSVMSQGFGAIINLGKMVGSSFGNLIGIFGKFAAALGVSSLALVGIIIGVVALAAGAYLLIKNWDTAVPFFKGLWGVLKSVFSTGGSAIMVAVREIQLGLAKFLDFTASNLLSLYSGLFGFLAKIPGIGSVFASVQTGIESLRGSLKGFVSSSEKDLDNAKTNIKNSASNTNEAWNTMTNAAKEMGKGMGNTIKDSVDNIKDIFQGIPTTAKSIEPDFKKAGKDAIDAYGDGFKFGEGDNTKKAAAAAKKLKDEMISNINNLNSAVLSALRRRYDAQREMDNKTLQTEMTNLDKWKTAQLKSINDVHNAMITSLDAETKSKTDALQSQIDALDAQQTAEEKARQNKDELGRIIDLQNKLAAETDANQRLQIQKDLNDAIISRTERLHNDEINTQKDSLRKQIDNLISISEDKKKQLDTDLKSQTDNFNAIYDAEKESLDTRKINLDKFYADKESAASLNAESEKMIMDKNQKSMVDLLNSYGNAYEDSGQSLGERFFNGFKSWSDSIAELIKNAATGISVSSGGSSKTKTGYNEGSIPITNYNNDKTAFYKELQRAQTVYQDRFEAGKNINAQKAWLNNLSNIQKIQGFASGGIVTKPTLLIAGEGNDSEVILPLNRIKDYFPKKESQTVSYYFEKMFSGAIFHVRDENDIKKIADEIYNMTRRRERGLGVRT